LQRTRVKAGPLIRSPQEQDPLLLCPSSLVNPLAGRRDRI
jgi:hypothetical protein